jgi:hypothetical protein
MRNEITRLIPEVETARDYLIIVNDVYRAVLRLNTDKNDGRPDGISTDHFIFACRDSYVLLSLLFNSLLIYGTISDSSNCRGIALSSIYGKLLDLIAIL